MPRGRFKHDSLPTLQISLRIVALFEKIYYGGQIITVFPFFGRSFTTPDVLVKGIK